MNNSNYTGHSVYALFILYNMKTKNIAVLVFSFLFLISCSSDDSNGGVDQEKPVIDMSISGGFPTSCTTVTRGEVINFKSFFTDNNKLGAYSISIHNNFDHHSHDTEVDDCNLNPVKTPVNPWTETFTYTIPENSKEFLAEQQIAIPNEIDTGDYHFMIQLSDAQGWATLRGISIKVVE